MAWISVHETVISMKLRKLSKVLSCSQNEALGILIRLWLWGINNADEYGNIVDATEEDICDALSAGLSNNIEPPDVVQALIDVGYLDRPNNEGLKLHNWDIWQQQWYKMLKQRAKWRERYREEQAKKKSEESPKVTRKRKEYPTDFEKFWQVYPRKIGKGEAYKCYKARVADGWSPENLEMAARKYALQVEKMHTEEKYIKHPKTFLSASTPFTDYLENENTKPPQITEQDDSDFMKDWR